MGMSKQSMYLQIVSDVKRKVDLGLLKENDKLPSCRETAVNLGINPNTVQRAYSTLEEQGYIFTVPKKGVYVCARDRAAAAESAARDKITELKAAGVSPELLKKLIEEVYGVDL